MKVAVSGATGFIGLQVLAELAFHPVDIVAVVRDATKVGPVSPGTKVVQIDMKSAPDNAFHLMGHPDVLIHLAWGGLPNYRSLHHFEEELPSQYRFLANLVKAGLPALVVAGTCFEYGLQSGPLSEVLETRPNNPYGYAKDALHRQLEFLRHARPFLLTWARLFYLYGEGQSETSLWAQVGRAVERGEEFFDMSGGEQLRDYLSLNQVAKYLVSLALKKANIGAVNICSGNPISVRSLVEGWIRENGWQISLNLGHYPYPDYEPMAFWGDCRKLAEIVG